MLTYANGGGALLIDSNRALIELSQRLTRVFAGVAAGAAGAGVADVAGGGGVEELQVGLRVDGVEVLLTTLESLQRECDASGVSICTFVLVK
jgi:hypothetical protein